MIDIYGQKNILPKYRINCNQFFINNTFQLQLFNWLYYYFIWQSCDMIREKIRTLFLVSFVNLFYLQQKWEQIDYEK